MRFEGNVTLTVFLTREWCYLSDDYAVAYWRTYGFNDQVQFHTKNGSSY